MVFANEVGILSQEYVCYYCVTNVGINRKQDGYFVIGIYTLLVSVEYLGLSEKIVRFFNVNLGVFEFEVH